MTLTLHHPSSEMSWVSHDEFAPLNQIGSLLRCPFEFDLISPSSPSRHHASCVVISRQIAQLRLYIPWISVGYTRHWSTHRCTWSIRYDSIGCLPQRAITAPRLCKANFTTGLNIFNGRRSAMSVRLRCLSEEPMLSNTVVRYGSGLPEAAR